MRKHEWVPVHGHTSPIDGGALNRPDTSGGGSAGGGSGGSSSTPASLNDLSDVVITAATAGDRLRFDGAFWVNSAIRWEPHVDYTGSVVVDGNGDPVMVEMI